MLPGLFWGCGTVGDGITWGMLLSTGCTGLPRNKVEGLLGVAGSLRPLCCLFFDAAANRRRVEGLGLLERSVKLAVP